MTPDPQAHQDIGRLEGIVEMLREQHQENRAEFAAIRGDITTLKVDAGKQGAVYGGAVAIGVALIIEGMKGWVRQKTGSGPG
jgi:hypothetical protein